MRHLLPITTAATLLLAGCGDAPHKFDQDASRAGQHSADDGHGHASVSWSGVIVLKGPRAESQTGVLMVSLVTRGQRMPRLSYRIDLAAVPPAENGERRVPFKLDETTDMLGAGLPGELADTPLEISVRFDADGMVETKEGDITVAAPVGWGGQDIEVVVGG